MGLIFDRGDTGCNGRTEEGHSIAKGEWIGEGAVTAELSCEE